MKLKTSCFEPAISHAYWKRFAPMSILYTVGMLILTLGNVNGQSSTIAAVYDVQGLCQTVVICNLIYGAVAAQLLVGDLYTPRLSYALHALPITMGGWFGTQVVLGIVSVLPGILLSGIAMMMLLTAYRATVLIWMLCALLSFLWFFGSALVSSVCAGNRLGMLLLYCILNFTGILVHWARIRIFGSLIYGLYVPSATLYYIPVYAMAGENPFDVDWSSSVTAEMKVMSDSEIYFSSARVTEINYNGNLWLYALYAVLGCILIALAVYLLHKRRPECAGDFLAFRVTEPVILVLCALFSGIAGHIISNNMGFGLDYPLLFVGIIIGYYVALMLLKRQVNVFPLKTLPLLLVVLVVALGSITATGLELVGGTYEIPEADEVAQVTIEARATSCPELTFSDADDIAQVIAMHQECLDNHRQAEQSLPLLQRIFGNEENADQTLISDDESLRKNEFILQYSMKDGSTLYRNYTIYSNFSCVEFLRNAFSEPEVVFPDRFFQGEEGKLDVESLKDSLTSCSMYAWTTDEEGYMEYDHFYIQYEDLPGLVDAILADCEAHNAAQCFVLHTDRQSAANLWISYMNPDAKEGEQYGFEIDIYYDSTNTCEYLDSHGYNISTYEALEAYEAASEEG